MASDPIRPHPSDLNRLLGVLDRAGGDATVTELAEILWLAGHSGWPLGGTPTASTLAVCDESLAEPENDSPPDEDVDVTDPQQPPRGGDLLLTHPTDPKATDRSRPYAPLLVPLPPMLGQPLALQRAMRPLRRRVPSRRDLELDEQGTTRRIAHTGGQPGTWLPVLRPKPERWLTLHLVCDTGPTMPIWRPLLRELHHTLDQTGAFQGIRLLEITPEGHLLQPASGRPASRPPRDGRSVALVLSDCSGPQWHIGAESAERWYRTLNSWARAMPMAIVQPLPERLWRRTALPGIAGLLQATALACSNAALRFAPFDMPSADLVGLPVPILEPSARWFAHWAQLVAGPPGTEVPGVAAMLPTDLSSRSRGPAASPLRSGEADARLLGPEELVLNFRAYASPQALRLAAHLAVGEPSLPMMRLIQAATEVRPEPQHLAEVVLSGLLTTAPGTPFAAGRYTFRPGVREVLLRTLPRSTAARIAAVIQRHAGSRAGELPVVSSGSGSERDGGYAGDTPLAAVSEETMRRLGVGPVTSAESQSPTTDGPGLVIDNRYLLGERYLPGSTSDTWRATDLRSDTAVLLKLFRTPASNDAARRRFVADAERLAVHQIQGLVPVTGFGFHHGRPFVITHPPEGQDLGQLITRTNGMPLHLIGMVADQVATTLVELHRSGLTHLDLAPSAVMILSNRRVLVTDPGLGGHGLPSIDAGPQQRDLPDPAAPPYPFQSPEQLFGGAADHRSDLYSLGCLLYAMATGSPPNTTYRGLRNALVHGARQPHPRVRSGISAEFDVLVTELLALHPEDRPVSSDELPDRITVATRVNDSELSSVTRALLAADPDGTRVGSALREAIDATLDGPRTGRFDLLQLSKVERGGLGTQVEIAVQREFQFEDGDRMDFRISGVDVDCKFSRRFGGWMFPPETLGELCLLLWADDVKSQWSAGLFRVDVRCLTIGRNRDNKRTLSAQSGSAVRWLWRDRPLRENTLLHLSLADVAAVMTPKSTTERLAQLFRRVQRRCLGANCLRTVTQQEDYVKRVRDVRRRVLEEGIILIGHQHRGIADSLGLPVPGPREWVSARITPYELRHRARPAVKLNGQHWTLAEPEDPPCRAPLLGDSPQR